MKITTNKNKSIPTVDWSEFHIWSPNGVLKLIKTDSGKDYAVASSHHKKSTMRASLVACGACIQRGIHNMGLGPRRPQSPTPSPTPTVTEKPQPTVKPQVASVTQQNHPHHHHHHHHHHSLMEEAYVHLFAGALGGSTATYTTHWLDTVKVKMQTQPGVFPGGLSCLGQTLQTDGIRGLYKGAMTAVTGQACKTSVVFVSYGLCEEAVRRATGCEYVEDMTIWHHAGSGAMTGIVASFVLCPLELLKCRLQAINQITQNPAQNQGQTIVKSMTSLQMARHVLKKKGLPGLYRGLPGIWVKEVPGSFIYFGSYEFAKYTVRTVSEKEHLNRRAVFLCGMYAGLCFCVTHPIESVKTRVQVMSAISQTKGFMRAFVHILKSEGFMPLCSGLGPSMIRACLYSGIQFVTYETVKDFFLDD